MMQRMSGAGSGGNKGDITSDDLVPVLVAPAPSTSFPALVAHLMPFHIDYNGAAAVDSYLVLGTEPAIETTAAHGSASCGRSLLTTAFRGRKLYGTPLSLPPGWAGAIVLKPSAAEQDAVYARKQRAVQQARLVDERERKRAIHLESRRSEAEARRDRDKRLRAKQATVNDKVGEPASTGSGRGVMPQAGSAGGQVSTAEAWTEPSDLDDIDAPHDEEDEDLPDDLRYDVGAVDDSADEYRPDERASDGQGDGEEESDEDEEDRVRKKAKPRPRPRPRPQTKTVAAQTSKAPSSEIRPTSDVADNPLGLQPPPMYQSVSRPQQARAIKTAPQSFSMDDEDEEDEGTAAMAAYAAANAFLDPTLVDGDAITPIPNPEALAQTAAQAAYTASLAAQAMELGWDQQSDQGTTDALLADGGSSSTSAYFGHGGGKLVGGGPFATRRHRQDRAGGEDADNLSTEATVIPPSHSPSPAPSVSTVDDTQDLKSPRYDSRKEVDENSVVYGTGEASAKVDADATRRKSGRAKGALPKRYSDDDPPVKPVSGASSLQRASGAKAISSKPTMLPSRAKGTAGGSKTLSGQAASAGASAMRQWLAGSKGRDSNKSSSPANSTLEESSSSPRRSSRSRSPVKRLSESSASVGRPRKDVDPDSDGHDGRQQSLTRRPSSISNSPTGTKVEVLIESPRKASSRWELSGHRGSSSGSSSILADVADESQFGPKRKVQASAKSSPARKGTRSSPRKKSVPKNLREYENGHVKPDPEGERVAVVATKQVSKAIAVEEKTLSLSDGSLSGSERDAEGESDVEGEGEGGGEGEVEASPRTRSSKPSPAKTSNTTGTSTGRAKRVWAKRWTFEERVDLMLGELPSSLRPTALAPSHEHETTPAAAAGQHQAQSDAIEGLAKLRVVGRLSTSMTTSSGPPHQHQNSELAKAVGQSGIVVWNADGPLDEGDDAVVRTVGEMLGVWALLHAY